MSTNKGHWFWESDLAAAQYRREHGRLPWPSSSANCSTGGDPAVIGWQADSDPNLDAWLDRSVLVAVDVDRDQECWRQVVCLKPADLDLLWARRTPAGR